MRRRVNNGTVLYAVSKCERGKRGVIGWDEALDRLERCPVRARYRRDRSIVLHPTKE